MRPAKSVTAIGAELADREAIRDVLLRYARATDRCDPDLLAELFWPDAVVNYEGFYAGDVGGYLTRSPEAMRAGMEQTAHLIANMLIDIEGEHAAAETYVLAFHRLRQDGSPSDLLLGGRYLDTLKKRNDYWRIASRTLIADWFREFPDSADWQKGFFGLTMTSGQRFPDDLSYALPGFSRAAGQAPAAQ